MTDGHVTTDDGVRLRVRSEGDRSAPALLLCNSLGTDLSLWDANVGALASMHHVIRFDQRGHGRSGAPPGPYTIDRLGRDAATVLAALEVGTARVCGVSLGGLVALWLAASEPGRVERVVLAATAARIGTGAGWRERAATVRAEGMAGVVDVVLERFFSPRFLGDAQPWVAHVRDGLLATTPEGYAASCDALAAADLRAAAAEVACPALVVVGTADAATPPSDAADLCARVGGARLVEIDGAGHLLNLEAPDRFAAIVACFLSGRADPTSATD